MRKNVFGRKLKRDINERKALFKSLMSSLVLRERIKTTEAKAKAIKGEADRLITKARKEEKLARKLLSTYLTPRAIEKLMSNIAPRFEKRRGGYTRIIKIGQRLSDGARLAMIEWVEGVSDERLPHVAQDARQSKTGARDLKTTSLSERRLRKSDKTSSTKSRRRSVLSQVGRRSSQKNKRKAAK